MFADETMMYVRIIVDLPSAPSQIFLHSFTLARTNKPAAAGPTTSPVAEIKSTKGLDEESHCWVI